MDSTFVAGDIVWINDDVLVERFGGHRASVCGVVEIQTQVHADSVVGGVVGANACLVEFPDGKSVEIATNLLIKANPIAECGD